jgi:trigger factor
MRATSETLEDNRIKLSVEIEEPELDEVLDSVVRSISREARIPGFRPGKVPRRVLEARMGGATALRAEALREALPDFYARAVVDTEVDPIAPPEIDITSGEESGPVAFEATVQVRPLISLPGYDGLVVTVPAPGVTDEELDAQIDRLRDNDGELVEIQRPAIDGDFVTIDIHGTDPAGEEVAAADDYLYEVGSGTVVAELDEQLHGATPGHILQFDAAPEGGPTLAFRVLVKNVQEKHLPEATDEWAQESSEFATVDELRDDLRTRLATMKAAQAKMALRENTLGELVKLVDDEVVPDVLVDDEVRQRVHDLGHRLQAQGLTIDQFLGATGRDGDALVEELRIESRGAVKIDLALRAIAEAERLEVSDEEFDEELEAMAERMNLEAGDLRDQLDHNGRTGAVRSEQRKAKALTWLLDHVGLVDDEGHEVPRGELEIEMDAEESVAAPSATAASDEGAETEEQE